MGGEDALECSAAAARRGRSEPDVCDGDDTLVVVVVVVVVVVM